MLALFPVAALWALWPGHWKALLNWGKGFVSVKLWVVFWAALAAFNQGRYNLILGNDPSQNGIGNQIEIFPAIAAMYLLTPMLSFMIVSLATNCGAIALQAFVPPAGKIGGLSDLHREYSEMKQDVHGAVENARTASMPSLDMVGASSSDLGGSGSASSEGASVAPPPAA